MSNGIGKGFVVVYNLRPSKMNNQNGQWYQISKKKSLKDFIVFFVNFDEWMKHVATLVLGSRPRQGLVKVQAKSEAWESHFHVPKSVGKCERMNPHTPK